MAILENNAGPDAQGYREKAENTSGIHDASSDKRLLILGTRGVPAVHGGFETLAERLAIYLVERGWQVTVYCQRSGARTKEPEIGHWNGVRQIIISTPSDSALGTVEFDWKCTLHALKESGIPLVLGYNTAIFTLLLRMAGRPVITNMDGIEWKRGKWGLVARVWFYINEWIGALFSTNMIADHPVIADHLSKRRSRDRITTIPYGADAVKSASEQLVRAMGLKPRGYFLSVSRIEPENSILEMVQAFSSRPRTTKFLCLGKFDPDHNRYHAAVKASANANVLFPGPIYERERVQSLRFHCLAYCHGHTVGGTNPSLVEALGAGSVVIANDNVFNRWVAGDNAAYFRDATSCSQIFDHAEADLAWCQSVRDAMYARFGQGFTWPEILQSYEALLVRSIAPRTTT